MSCNLQNLQIATQVNLVKLILGMHAMKIRKLVIFLLLFYFPLLTFANVIQRFYGNNYMSPAQPEIHDFQFISGAALFDINGKFRGEAFGRRGVAGTNKTDTYPYFFIGKRVLPKIVLGLNVSQPFEGHTYFRENSILAFAVTETDIHDVDFNFMLSYNVNKKLTLGAGIIFNDLYKALLNRRNPILGNVILRTSGWSVGYDFGLNYVLDDKTFINLSYFSELSPILKGFSSAGPLYGAHAKVVGLHLPATSSLQVTRKWTKKWVSAVRVFYNQWNHTQVIKITRVVPTNIRLPVHYHNVFTVGVFNRYQICDKFAGIGIFIFDQGAARNHGITNNFPAVNVYIFKAGGEYKITKDASMQLMYAYNFGRPRINRPLGNNIIGKQPFHGNSVEGMFKFNV